MDRDSRIFVAGHRGLVGSAVCRRLEAEGYGNLILRTHSELDLTDQLSVNEFFKEERPDHVFLAAAKVGGIMANSTYPAEFIYDNLMIEANIIHASYVNSVGKLLFLGSSCIYPKFAPQPMREEHLLSGELEVTNEAYAIAKIAGIRLCKHYNQQYGTNFISVMPTNLYGPNDNYDPVTSHVLPALLRKFHEAKVNGDDSVVLWGTGTPRREFLHVDDLADACVFLMQNHDADDVGELINIGVGHDLTIRALGELIADVVGFDGRLVFDDSKPDGTPQKLLDVSRMEALGWRANIPLREGLEQVYRLYADQEDNQS